MQHVSKEYKTSMKQIWRNIGYIKVYLGIINEDAQKALYLRRIFGIISYICGCE